MDASPGALINFTVSGLDVNQDYHLSYSCISNSFPEPCSKIVNRAYYQATNQSVFRITDATIFAGSTDYTSIELPIMVGNIIRGTLSTPGAQTAPVGGVSILVTASASNSPEISYSSFSTTILIAEGQTGVSYEVMIPDDSSETWEVGYACQPSQNPNGACDSILIFGHYDSSATNSTSDLSANAEALPGGQDSSSIDLTLLTGYAISGVLSVPTAPTEVGGITLRMNARDDNNPVLNANKLITIAQGNISAPYELTVPKDMSADWLIRYECQPLISPIECNKYLAVGYFDSDVIGTMATPDLTGADRLGGGQTHNGIDFSILSGFAISGILSLSDGVAPDGGIRFKMIAVNTSGSGSVVAEIEIEENQSQTSYQLNVDTNVGKEWRIDFECQEVFSAICTDIANMGYYDANSGNTVDDPNNAASLAGGVSHPGINLIVDSSILREDEICVPIKATGGAIAVICL